MSNHSFDIHIATEYKSVDIAILIWHFQYWIIKNKRLNRNQHEGRTWTYQTLQEIAALFPYWSVKQVERLLNKAVSLKILIKGNFNKAKFDRTVWYAFNNEEKFSISRIREMEISESGNPKPEIGTPIPNTLPNTLTNKEREKAKPSAHSSKLIERQLHVCTTEAEHEKLVESHGTETVERLYKILSDWKTDTPRSKWKKCDYRSILRWVVNAQSEKENTRKYNKTMDEKSDRQLAEKIWQRFKNEKGNYVDISSKYLEFRNGIHVEYIEFGSKNFRDKCLEQLRKRKLNAEGL